MAQKKGTQAYVEPVALEKLYEAFPNEGKQDTISAAAEVLTRLRYETGVASISGLQDTLEFMVRARRYTNYKLRGMFTREEMTGLMDIFNGVLMRGVAIPAKEIFMAQVMDANAYEGVAAQYGFDMLAIETKIEAMSLAEAEFMLLEILVFWEQESSKEGGMDAFLDKFCPIDYFSTDFLKDSVPLTREEFLVRIREQKKNQGEDSEPK